MLGFGLGVLIGLSYIGVGLEPEGVSVPAMYLSPIAVLAVAWLVGLLFTKTIGIASMFAMLGAAVGAVIALFNAPALTPALLLHAGTYLLCQHGMQSRLNAYRDMDLQRRAHVPQSPGKFVSRREFGDGVYADFYVRDGELICTMSPGLQAAQPPLEMFYAMEVEKEFERLTAELAASPSQ